MEKLKSKAFWLNLVSFNNKNLLVKIVYVLVLFMLIPFLWWVYLLGIGYVLLFKGDKVKEYYKNNKKKVLKYALYLSIAFAALVAVIMYFFYAYGGLQVNDLPKLTNQKKIMIAGASSYKDGTVLVKVNDKEVTTKIDVFGEYKLEVELSEGGNSIRLLPISVKGKRGWDETIQLTLDTIAPEKPFVEGVVDKTTDENLEITVVTSEDGKVEVEKDGKNVATADSNNKKAKLKLALTEGENLFNIFAIDKATNKSKEFGVYKVIREKKVETQVQTQKTDNFVVVKRVVDGDTVELEDGSKVRYIGIDTPETSDPTRGLQCYGKEATNKNKSLVEGKKVRLEKDVSETDKYGRLLRYLYLEDNTFVNLVLVKDGFARSSTYPPDVKHQNEFTAAEREARENGRGLWSATTCNGTTTQVQTQTQTQTYVAPVVTPTIPVSSGNSGDCNIKGNISSGGKIYHVPGGAYYDKTEIDTSAGERWFCSEAEAVAAGWRASQR